MPKVTFIRPFSHSDDGFTVRTYMPGERDVTDRCAEIAMQEGAIESPFVAGPIGVDAEPSSSHLALPPVTQTSHQGEGAQSSSPSTHPGSSAHGPTRFMPATSHGGKRSKGRRGSGK